MAEPDPASELYRVDPDAFVEARNRLVKDLRAEGRRDEAARTAKLRRPPPSAWALNQVARDRPELVDGVLDAGAALRRAMEDALGGDPSGVREAQAAERRAVDAAVVAAAQVLAAGGKQATDAVRLRIAASLRAAVVDDQVADLVRRGVLDADRDAPGFGLDGFSVAAAPAAARRARTASARPAPASPDAESEPRPQGDRAAEEAERRRLAGQADEAEDRARRLEREAGEAERRAGQLAASAAEAAAEAETAARRAERLEAEAADAARRAGQARAEADAADVAARDARRRVEGA